jgi:multiple sugar transport system permease protein
MAIPELAGDRRSGRAKGARGRRSARAAVPRVIKGVVIAFVLAVGLLGLAPLYWMIVTSLETSSEALNTPPNWFPTHLTVANFRLALESAPLIRMFLNSLEVTSIIVAGSLIIGSAAAYGFARVRPRGSKVLFAVLLGGIMIPAQVAVVPIFVVMRDLHLINQLASVYLPALINVVVIFLLCQYIISIPRELDEAASIDGAGHFTIWLRIIFPLTRPALVAAGVFIGQTYWNDFFWPSVFLSTPSRMTLPVGLVELQSQTGGGESVTVVFAAIVLVVLPATILLLACQRYLVRGISLAAGR